MQIHEFQAKNIFKEYGIPVPEGQVTTNPKEATKGTIRADFANSIDANAVHGSDSETSALREINYFFNNEEIVSK